MNFELEHSFSPRHNYTSLKDPSKGCPADIDIASKRSQRLNLQFCTTKFIYVLRRFEDIRHLPQELWSPDVGMVITDQIVDIWQLVAPSSLLMAGNDFLIQIASLIHLLVRSSSRSRTLILWLLSQCITWLSVTTWSVIALLWTSDIAKDLEDLV